MSNVLKQLFREEFTTAYIQHMKDTCECGGRDIEEVLFMAFCRGYEVGRAELEAENQRLLEDNNFLKCEWIKALRKLKQPGERGRSRRSNEDV